ncbi:hypothetical protein BC831DRAFT_412338 [Entophlyctis helioformis]|nr:hypothetical protein BC831DRAFT_412338 [Entophlyctis helioformis]
MQRFDVATVTPSAEPAMQVKAEPLSPIDKLLSTTSTEPIITHTAAASPATVESPVHVAAVSTSPVVSKTQPVEPKVEEAQMDDLPVAKSQSHKRASVCDYPPPKPASGKNPVYTEVNENTGEGCGMGNIDSSVIIRPKKAGGSKRGPRKSPEQLPKTYPCAFEGCNKMFNRPEHVVRHNRMHTGERPYKCPMEDCGKSFTRSDNLSSHLKVHVRLLSSETTAAALAYVEPQKQQQEQKADGTSSHSNGG